VNEEALAHWGLLNQIKKKNAIRTARHCTEQRNVESTTLYHLCTPSIIRISLHLYYCRSHLDINFMLLSRCPDSSKRRNTNGS